MHSKVHPTYKTKYRVANWASYDRALVGRGDIPLWVSAEAIDTWEPVGVGTRGGQQKYSDVVIDTALLRLLFHLPLRQAEGFLQSLFGTMGIDLAVPDHTTLSRRGQHLDLTLVRVPTGKGLHPIVDSTGLSTGKRGMGCYETQRAREARLEEASSGCRPIGVIVAHALTEATAEDATTAITLINAVDGGLTSVTGDAAYDTIAFYETAAARGATVVVPPNKTARVLDGDRGRALGDRTIKKKSVGGRRRLAIIDGPGWRTLPFGPNRSSAGVFARALLAGE